MQNGDQHYSMEDETYTDIDGKAISLECQSHSGFCREFTVSSAKVSIGRVMAYTCAVWLSAYIIFFVTENTAVLSSAIIITLVGMMVHIHFVKVDHETLLIIGSLGVQVSSSYASGRESTDFIEMGKIKDIVINEAIHMVRKIKDIVINEAIHMQTVIYYLCILLKDPSDPEAVSSVVPLFQSSKPRLNCLVKVYKSCQEILAKC
uniref:Phosphatidylinositol N-acetylglucosaminyltransferase subunit H conserved domain-containing protein n=2 Tax=Oncorhynchus TaxID=8016 RepID=A0A8C8LQH9_ONCTS